MYVFFFGLGLFFFLIVLNELFLHEQVVLDPFEFELPEAALCDGSHSRKLSGRVDSLPLFLPADARRGRDWFFLGLLVAVVLVLFVPVDLISHIQKYFKFISRALFQQK